MAVSKCLFDTTHDLNVLHMPCTKKLYIRRKGQETGVMYAKDVFIHVSSFSLFFQTSGEFVQDI